MYGRSGGRFLQLGAAALLLTSVLIGCRKEWGSAVGFGARAAAAEQPAASSEQPPAAAPNKPAQTRQVAKPVVAEYAPNVPPVLLSAGHARLCQVGVGDQFPAIVSPQIGSGPTKLSTFAGERATVVLFWTPGHWMSRWALADVAKEVAAEARDSSVGVIGVAESQSPESVQEEISKAGARFSQLLDADGSALAQVGTDSLPRVYVLDGNHRVAWFDIEYSEATRRELRQTLDALNAK